MSDEVAASPNRSVNGESRLIVCIGIPVPAGEPAANAALHMAVYAHGRMAAAVAAFLWFIAQRAVVEDAHAGCVFAEAAHQCVRDLFRCDRSPSGGCQPAEAFGDFFAEAEFAAVAEQQGRSRDGERRPFLQFNAELEFTLDEVVEHSRVRARPGRADQRVMRRAGGTRQPSEDQRILEIDATKRGLRTGVAHCRAERAEHLVDIEPVRVSVEMGELGDACMHPRIARRIVQWPSREHAHFRDCRIGKQCVERGATD